MKVTVRQLLPILISIAGFCSPDNLQAQEYVESGDIQGVSIKTNLLYDATTTFNLGAEFRLGKKMTLDIPVNYNPWTFSDNKKWKHILVQPEIRKWTRQAFQGHFFGLHGHYSSYNVGGLDNPPFSEYMNTHRLEGWLVGAGISYGYRWNFSHRWGMEAIIGIGYAYLSYDKYPCYHCGEKQGSASKNYVGPTKAGISLIYHIGKKKKNVQPEPILDYIHEVQSPLLYNPKLSVSFFTPAVEEVKRRSTAGKAYLDFEVGKSEILPTFRNNANELQRIYELIERLKNNSDTTITGIKIIGHASPEGVYNANLTLSGNRATALANHLKKKYGFANELFHLEEQGEDWQMLEKLVKESDVEGKQQILAIIQDVGVFGGREKKLMDLLQGKPYLQIKEAFFPQLRRTDYELHYTVLPFTVEKGKEVFKNNPSALSLNEMFLIAATYERGSDAYNEVFEKAAELFPHSDVANLNAAASALDRKDVSDAEEYLTRVVEKNAVYWNNAGVLMALRKEYTKAMELFNKAKAAGNIQAIDNVYEIAKIK